MKKIKKTKQKWVRFDWAIKYLLRNKANFGILEGFLSELLHIPVEIEEILESESNQESKEDKFNRVDILVKTTADERIIIEVQAVNEWDYMHRMLYGTSKVITEFLSVGEGYGEIKKVISVNIVFFDLGEGEDYIYRGQTTFKGVHRKDTLKLGKYLSEKYGPKIELPQDIFPDFFILKVNQFNERIKNKFDEWMYFLKTESIKPDFSAKGLKEASKTLDYLKLNPKEQRSYARFLDEFHSGVAIAETHRLAGLAKGRQEGREEGLQEGRQEGREEERKVLVRKLVQRGMRVEEIAEMMGMSRDDIEILL